MDSFPKIVELWRIMKQIAIAMVLIGTWLLIPKAIYMDAELSARSIAEERMKLVLQLMKANPAFEECNKKMHSGELKTNVTHTNCTNPVLIQALQKAGFRHTEWLNLVSAKTLDLAEKADRGGATDKQATDEETARYMYEILRRDVLEP